MYPLRGDTGTLPSLAWFATATREEVVEASKQYAKEDL